MTTSPISGIPEAREQARQDAEAAVAWMSDAELFLSAAALRGKAADAVRDAERLKARYAVHRAELGRRGYA